MPLQETSGTASYDAFGGGAAVAPIYIEDVYSTFLYTGNSSTQTITNGIDLAGKGGLVWFKRRNGAGEHSLFDTARGATKYLQTQATTAQTTNSTSLTSFNADGFSLGNNGLNNFSGETFATWTFRKQPKFFDVVTYTGNGTSQTINHNLGSKPGFIIVKNASFAANWITYHQSLGATQGVVLNSTAAAATNSGYWNDTEPTSTQFTVGSSSLSNRSGDTFVAYLFAHNAGGFGLTGTDNVISCGSFTTDGSGNATVNLGYEPQWIMARASATTDYWRMFDTMRGLSLTGNRALFANDSLAESNPIPLYFPTATGFVTNGAGGNLGLNTTYIYIAIRRGPMKTPTSGTSVFAPISSANSTGTKQTTSFPVDMQWLRYPQAGYNNFAIDRLRGVGTSTSAFATPYLVTNTTDAEATLSSLSYQWDNTGFGTPSAFSGLQSIYWNFQRAPGFFDEVCYTGTGAFGSQVVTHNLGVVPQLIIVKSRSGSGANNEWAVYHNSNPNLGLWLNSTGSYDSLSIAAPFGPITSTSMNPASGSAGAYGVTGNYVAYLFASCPGVSKVGSYTGNGSTQTINCGFTGGARFVLIKRTDSTGDWYVYDTARGMTTLTDPYLLLNSTAAESATLGSVTSVTGGFALNASILAAINTNAASYIFLAIA